MANLATRSFGQDAPSHARAQPTRVGPSSLPSAHLQNRELFRVKAYWIVDLFPDELVVQEKTVSVIHNEFLVSFVETIT